MKVSEFRLNEKVMLMDSIREVFTVRGINDEDGTLLLYGDWSGMGIGNASSWVKVGEVVKTKLVPDVPSTAPGQHRSY